MFQALDEDEIQRVAMDFFNKNGSPVNADVWKHNADKLVAAIGKGYGFAYNEQDVKLNYELKNNVAVFSAFKAWRMGKDVSRLLVDENGNKRQWGAFLKEFRKTNKTYNVNWLAAEYNLAQGQAQAARDWQKYERDKDIYPNLRYLRSLAVEPRQAHQNYYGVVKPIDDPFWDNALPPNGWNCQCRVQQTDDPADDRHVETTPPPKGIVGNAGKTGMVFTPEHPYLKAAGLPEKQLVKEAFNQLRPALDAEHIVYHGDKGKVNVSLNADPQDYLQNFRYAKVVMDKYEGTLLIRPHSFVDGNKNPEYDWDGTIGDRTEMKGANPRNYIKNSFNDKLRAGEQLRDFNETFIALDFSEKLTEENMKAVASKLYGEFNAYPKVKFVLLKNADKVVKIESGIDFNAILDKMAKGLL
jgi:hypothetical protein